MMYSRANSRKASHVYLVTSGFLCTSSDASGSKGAISLSFEKQQSPRKNPALPRGMAGDPRAACSNLDTHS